MVPNMFWKVSHHFRELENQVLLNSASRTPGCSNAQQDIDLGWTGAEPNSSPRPSLRSRRSRWQARRRTPQPDLRSPLPLLYEETWRGAPLLCHVVDNAELLSSCNAEAGKFVYIVGHTVML